MVAIAGRTSGDPGARGRIGLAFVAATCSLVLVFAGSGTPIPLFNLYRAEDGITNAELAIVSVAYFIAAATSLLVLGRLSNHLGRKPVALAGLILAALACLILIGTRGVHQLLGARVLQGLAVGLGASALGSYVIDSAPERPRWLAAAVTGSAPVLGIPTGALLSGALVGYAPAPRVLVYAVMAGLLTICATLIAMSPETVARGRGAIASLRPRLQVPVGSGRLLLPAGAVFVATWSFGSFYQSFGPPATAQWLGTTNPLVNAAVFSSVMLLGPVGGPLTGRIAPAAGLRLAMALFVLAVVGAVASLAQGAVVPFIAASLVAGFAQGAASTCGIRALLATAQLEERAGLLATIYLIAYSAAAFPGIIAGQLTGRFDLLQIAMGYAALGVGASVVAILTARDPPRHPAAGHADSGPPR